MHSDCQCYEPLTITLRVLCISKQSHHSLTARDETGSNYLFINPPLKINLLLLTSSLQSHTSTGTILANNSSQCWPNDKDNKVRSLNGCVTVAYHTAIYPILTSKKNIHFKHQFIVLLSIMYNSHEKWDHPKHETLEILQGWVSQHPDYDLIEERFEEWKELMDVKVCQVMALKQVYRERVEKLFNIIWSVPADGTRFEPLVGWAALVEEETKWAESRLMTFNVDVADMIAKQNDAHLVASGESATRTPRPSTIKVRKTQNKPATKTKVVKTTHVLRWGGYRIATTPDMFAEPERFAKE